MKKLSIADATLVGLAEKLSFKEKIEIARRLDSLQPDVIELPAVKNVTADTLFIRTVSAFVKNSTVSVCAGLDVDEISAAAAASAAAKSAIVRIEVPVSPVKMEYVSHMKPKKVLEKAADVFKYAVEKCPKCEFYAVDATRADVNFLGELVQLAVDNGIDKITLCNDEGKLLPDEFADFVADIREKIPVLKNVSLGIVCRSDNGLSVANALSAIKYGADEIKTSSICGNLPETGVLAKIINNDGDRIGVCCGVNFNELQRITRQIERIVGNADDDNVREKIADSASLTAGESLQSVRSAVKSLGYDLSEEDYKKVYDEVTRVACNKKVTARELEAIIAGVAMQVPPTYKLISYVVNNGNILPASAQIKLSKNDKELFGISTGDGPVDAAFKTLEQIIDRHFELDDFQIQAVTEGREALGSALVKLKFGGKLYSGNGISTDIIGSSISAYINAVNKIVYEEAMV